MWPVPNDNLTLIKHAINCRSKDTLGCLRYKNVEVADCNWKSDVACCRRPSATQKIGTTDFRFPFVAFGKSVLFLLSPLILNVGNFCFCFFVFKIIFRIELLPELELLSLETVLVRPCS